MNASAPGSDKKKRRAKSTVAQVTTLDSLLGAHPSALRDIYRDGVPADPSTMPSQLDGRILALESMAGMHMLGRPLMSLAARIMPWRGKVFESGGTAGINRLVSGKSFRFHCEGAPSILDDLPTLRIAYDGLNNPLFVERIVDEIRMVGPKVGIGPVFHDSKAAPRLLLWWGLECP
jgi:hypothetical protein